MYPIGAELSVSENFYRHVSVYLGGGMVAHNHPDTGESVLPVEAFSKGRPITVTKGGVSNTPLLSQRVSEMMASPSGYHYLGKNCEHTASKLRTGSASSPQVRFWAATTAIVAAAIAVVALRSK